MNIDSIVNRIINLYVKYGASDYIGEGISQLEHALQCAECAEKDIRMQSYDDYIKNCMIVAALLHDIGHLIGMEMGEMQMKDVNIFNGASLGIIGHENIGREYLQKCGMPFLICELVGSHVLAKRYLCTTKKQYYDKLSDASKETMKMQGGLMTPKEINDFKSSIMPELKIYLREYDDLGKQIYNTDNTDNTDNTVNTENDITRSIEKIYSIEKYKKYIEIVLSYGKL
jgi:predicted HD phosphohydrolase